MRTTTGELGVGLWGGTLTLEVEEGGLRVVVRPGGGSRMGNERGCVAILTALPTAKLIHTNNAHTFLN